MQRIIYTQHSEQELASLINSVAPDRVFLLCDENTQRLCAPRIPIVTGAAQVIVIAPSDAAKNLDTLRQVWEALQMGGATRHSLLINLGGGMVTDLGGFAASTFKRGISFINVPTTLLAMVDAAVGGKTGINFGGLKNEIGAFAEASAVIIDTQFLATLDEENLRSGYAEMLKHSLLSDRSMWAEHLRYDLTAADLTQMQQLVEMSIKVKQKIVTEDPHERGIRKALNLGHTVGHAIESYYLQKSPLLHGYAVAWGLVAELYIAAAQSGFCTEELHHTARFVFEHYGHPVIGCNDYDALLNFMLHDKKNRGGQINFTLLSAIGQVQIDQKVDKSLIFESLDFLRDA